MESCPRGRYIGGHSASPRAVMAEAAHLSWTRKEKRHAESLPVDLFFICFSRQEWAVKEKIVSRLMRERSPRCDGNEVDGYEGCFHKVNITNRLFCYWFWNINFYISDLLVFGFRYSRNVYVGCVFLRKHPHTLSIIYLTRKQRYLRRYCTLWQNLVYAISYVRVPWKRCLGVRAPCDKLIVPGAACYWTI